MGPDDCTVRACYCASKGVVCVLNLFLYVGETPIAMSDGSSNALQLSPTECVHVHLAALLFVPRELYLAVVIVVADYSDVPCFVFWYYILIVLFIVEEFCLIVAHRQDMDD